MTAHQHNRPLTEVELRVKALESLLTEKGLIDPAALDALIDTYETKIGPRNGAKVVARAWVDPAYKQRLLADAHRRDRRARLHPAARARTWWWSRTPPTVHNLVVCTLCSCYPWPMLGLPPVWYKSAPYRARAVIDPRGVLRGVRRRAARQTSRSGSGTAPPSSATWCCPSGRPAPRA